MFQSKKDISREKEIEADLNPAAGGLKEQTFKRVRVIVVGGSNLDLKGYAVGDYLQGTSNPGRLSDSPGGVGRNIAENLSLLGVPTALFSAVGRDHFGQQMIKQMQNSNLNLDFLIHSHQYRTGIYLAHLTEEGELVGAIADMEILEEISPEYITKHQEIIKAAHILVFDTNLREDTINLLVELAENSGIKTVAEPVSVTKSSKLEQYINRIDLLTPNLDELLAILQIETAGVQKLDSLLPLIRASYNEQELKTTFVVTLGRSGVLLLNQQIVELIPAYQVEEVEIKETTGAGDALTAGVVYGLLEGRPLKQAVLTGLKAAKLTIMSEQTVCPDLREQLLKFGK